MQPGNQQQATMIAVQKNILKNIVNGITVTSLIIAASIYLPIIGFFCPLFIPLPILFYRSKLDRTAGVIIPVVSIMLFIVMAGGISVIVLYFAELLLIGFVLAEFIELDYSIEKTILYTCGAVLFTGIASLLFYSNISNTGINALVSGYIAKNIELAMALYKDMEVSEENIHMISGSLESVQYIFVRIIPALAIASTLFIAWANLLIAKPLFKAKDISYPEFGHLRVWKVPEFVVWGIIGCGLMLILPDNAFKMFGLNGLIILMMIYFFQGIAILSFYFEKKQFPRMLRFFLYSLVALQQILLLIVIGLGFFDMWLNFRKLKTEKG